MPALIHTLIVSPQNIHRDQRGVEEQWLTACCRNSVVAACVGMFLGVLSFSHVTRLYLLLPHF